MVQLGYVQSQLSSSCWPPKTSWGWSRGMLGLTSKVVRYTKIYMPVTKNKARRRWGSMGRWLKGRAIVCQWYRKTWLRGVSHSSQRSACLHPSIQWRRWRRWRVDVCWWYLKTWLQCDSLHEDLHASTQTQIGDKRGVRPSSSCLPKMRCCWLGGMLG